MFVLVKVRSLNVEKTGENVDEDLTDPGSHLVGLRTSEMNVEHKNCYADAEGVEDHGEEDKLAEEGHHQGGGRDDLCQQEEEHGEGEEDGDGQTDLHHHIVRRSFKNIRKDTLCSLELFSIIMIIRGDY